MQFDQLKRREDSLGGAKWTLLDVLFWAQPRLALSSGLALIHAAGAAANDRGNPGDGGLHRANYIGMP